MQTWKCALWTIKIISFEESEFIEGFLFLSYKSGFLSNANNVLNTIVLYPQGVFHSGFSSWILCKLSPHPNLQYLAEKISILCCTANFTRIVALCSKCAIFQSCQAEWMETFRRPLNKQVFNLGEPSGWLFLGDH